MSKIILLICMIISAVFAEISIDPSSTVVGGSLGKLNGQFKIEGYVPITPGIGVGGQFQRSGPMFGGRGNGQHSQYIGGIRFKF